MSSFIRFGPSKWPPVAFSRGGLEYACRSLVLGGNGCTHFGNTALNFFTLAWWHGQVDDEAVDPCVTYREHFNRIEDRLPSAFVEFCKTISLHDSRLRVLRLDIAKQDLRMELTGDDGHGGLRQFTLAYLGVAALESNADPNNGLRGPYGYGDWGYDEADAHEGGLCEHRILFSSGIELRIWFRDFSIV